MFYADSSFTKKVLTVKASIVLTVDTELDNKSSCADCPHRAQRLTTAGPQADPVMTAATWCADAYDRCMTGYADHARGFDLRREHVSLDDSGATAPIEITAQFWPDVLSGRRQLGRWLLGANHRTENTASWDIHPQGECILTLLTGAVDIVLETDGEGGETVLELRRPGTSVVIPRGVWHRQVVHKPSDLLFLTAGEETEQRPVLPD